MLDRWVPGSHLTETEIEARFLKLCARAGLRLPETQVRFDSHRVDFLWRQQNLVVETDGYHAHRGRIAFGHDRAKDRALQAQGLEVQHFTWAEIVGAPRLVAAEVGAAIRRRS
ncbi:MAG: endonuclease domain-containing protein [Solirubrobacteraceae bacterium]